MKLIVFAKWKTPTLSLYHLFSVTGMLYSPIRLFLTMFGLSNVHYGV